MRSFAIWYDHRENSSPEVVSIQIHVNLWEKNICDGERGEICIDFGFLIHDIKNVAKVNLYCPFAVKNDQIEDLGSRICENGGLVNAIFNEDYGTRQEGKLKRYLFVDVPYEDNELKKNFIVYPLDIQADFRFERKGNGTIVSFSTENVLLSESETPPEWKDVRRYYFRFRIFVDVNSLKILSQKQKNLSPFQDAFITTQVIDFRINNLRSCNVSIGDAFAKGTHFNILAIHYLILRNASDVLIYYGKNLSSRLLEEGDLWAKYFDHLKDNIIAYHFKEVCNSGESKILEFVNLTRFEYRNWDKKLVCTYLYLLIYFGFIASFFVNILFDQCPMIYGSVICFLLTLIAIKIIRSIFKKSREGG